METGSQPQTQKVTVFAIEPTQTVCMRLFATLLRVYGKRSRTCLEIESKYNLFQIKEKKEIIWSDLSHLIGMVNLT